MCAGGRACTGWTAFQRARPYPYQAIAARALGGYGLVRLSADLGAVATLGAGLAALAGVLLEALRRAVADWSQTRLLPALVEDAPEAQIVNLVDRLADKL